jgi:hypothetical protein
VFVKNVIIALSEAMRQSSRLTRLILLDGLRTHLPASAILVSVLAVVSVLFYNPVISFKDETVLVIRNQQLPSKYVAVALVSFVETKEGKLGTISVPVGTIPPAPGSSIKVRHNKHLFNSDSFSWMK